MDHYHIFISHAWKYSDDYQTVVKWIDEAKAEGTLNWSNYSVPYHDPLVDPSTKVGKSKLQKLLENQISPASKIIVISGMYAAHSDWIDFEIDTSVSKGKYIIGLKPWGQERIPVKIQNNADIMVGWNKSSVINALLGK